MMKDQRMKLFIAEKPELARAIVEALPGEFDKRNGYFVSEGKDETTVVSYCMGHMLTLYDPDDYDPKYRVWSLQDLPMNLKPVLLKPIGSKQRQLDTLVSLIDEADEIIHAGDYDSEGQRIVDDVIRWSCKVCRPKRLIINDLNTNSVQKALANLRDNDDYRGLSNAAFARAVADQTYGMNMTRALTLHGRAKGYDGLLSSGSVQNVIFGLIVRRYLSNLSHQKALYFSLSGEFSFGKKISLGYLKDKDDEKVTQEEAAIAIKIATTSGAARISHLSTEIKAEAPPFPHNLLSLQSEAHKLYRIKPDDTLAITQRLREYYRLITYNRSDCQYLPDEHYQDAGDILDAISQKSASFGRMVEAADLTIKSRAFNSENITAHHAIAPTAGSSGIAGLSDQEKAVYGLIVRAYVAQFYRPYSYELTRVEVECGGHRYGGSSKKQLDKGWKVLFDAKESEEEVGEETDLSDLSLGMAGKCHDVKISRNYTKPLENYTFSTLLKDLTRVSAYAKDPKIKALLLKKDEGKKGEHGGIGTPATRSDIIKKLFDRGYIAEVKGKILPTEIGLKFYKALPPTATEPDMVALWHAELREISEGRLSIERFLLGVDQFVAQEIERLRREGLSLDIERYSCPKCEKGYLRKLNGVNGPFWACDQYRAEPSCRAAFSDVRGKPDLQPMKKSAVSKIKDKRRGSKGDRHAQWN